MDQGLNPMSSVKAMRSAHAPHPTARAPMANNAARTISQNPRDAKAAADEAALQSADKFKSITGLPMTLTMMPAFGAMILGGIAKITRRQRTTAVLTGTAQALNMNGTTIKGAFQLPANMVKDFATAAENVGGRAEKWVPGLVQKSKDLKVSGDAWAASASKIFAPVAEVGGKALKAIGLHAPASKAGEVIGKLPLRAGVAGLAFVGAVNFIWRARSKQSNDSARAIADMTATFGAEHPLVLNARGLQGKEARGTVLSSLFSTAGEVAFVAMESMPTMNPVAMAAGIGGQMMLPQAGELFKHENRVVGAFAMLQAESRGQVQLPPEQKMVAIQQLIGSMPVAQSHGGTRNRLAAGMARELIANKADFSAITDLLRDETKFTALAGKVAEQQKAAQAANATAAPAHAAMLQAAVPTAKITSGAHQGPVQAVNDKGLKANNDNGRTTHAERVRLQEATRASGHELKA